MIKKVSRLIGPNYALIAIIFIIFAINNPQERVFLGIIILLIQYM